MVQPNLAPSNPKKKKVPKNPTPKQQAREKYQKTLQKFKVCILVLLYYSLRTLSRWLVIQLRFEELDRETVCCDRAVLLVFLHGSGLMCRPE